MYLQNVWSNVFRVGKLILKFWALTSSHPGSVIQQLASAARLLYL